MTHSRSPQRSRRGFPWERVFTWANGLRALGTVGFLHELLIHNGPERAQILVLCGVLLGLPEFVGRDRKDR